MGGGGGCFDLLALPAILSPASIISSISTQIRGEAWAPRAPPLHLPLVFTYPHFDSFYFIRKRILLPVFDTFSSIDIVHAKTPKSPTRQFMTLVFVTVSQSLCFHVSTP